MTPGDAAAVAVLLDVLLTDGDTQPLPEPETVAYAVEHLVTAARAHERTVPPVEVAMERLDELMYGDDYDVQLSGEWHPKFRPIENVPLPRDLRCDEDSLGQAEILTSPGLPLTPPRHGAVAHFTMGKDGVIRDRFGQRVER